MMTLPRLQSVAIHEFFVAPADRNYLLARWTYAAGMMQEFWWQSLQAIEKYLKAALVLNGESVARYGHDISGLYSKHIEVFCDLAVTSFVKPAELPTKWWSGCEVGPFVERIESLGDPDTRYGMRSWFLGRDDLFLLDQLCFGLRRLTIGLDWTVGEHCEDTTLASYCGRPYRDVLREMPRHQVRKMATNDRRIDAFGSTTDDLLQSCNFEWGLKNRVDWPELPQPDHGGWNSSVSWFHRLLEKDAVEPDTMALLTWLRNNIRLPNDLREKIARRIESAAGDSTT